MTEESRPKPSAYALYRELKSAGIVTSVVSNGELLAAVGKRVPDAPQEFSTTANQ